MRVDMPQLVVWASSSWPSEFWNLMSCALEKVVPRKCEVPAWSALPSCIIASIE